MRALLPALLLSAGALCAGPEEMAVPSLALPSNQGAEAARILGKRIQNGKGVILLRDRIGAHASESAEESFLQTILTEFPDTPILVSDYHTGNSPESAQRIARGLFATHRENLGGVFASSEKAVVGAIAALKSLGIKIPLVGRVNHLQTAQALKDTYPAFIAQIGAPDRDEFIDIRFGDEAEPLTQKPFKLKSGDRRIDNIGLELVQIPGGVLKMGASQTLTVTLSPFYIGRFEITQAQWAFIMKENPSVFKTPQRPVDNVSWEQAVDFCQKLTDYARKIKAIDANERFQLPTEAQWEYTCLAGNQEPSITLDLNGYTGGNYALTIISASSLTGEENLSYSFINGGNGTNVGFNWIDSSSGGKDLVASITAIPEPASAAMLIGLIGLAATATRRRR